MKKIIFLASTLIFLACSSNNKEFTIVASVDLKDGNMVYRIMADANQQPLIIDSIAVKDGVFQMSGIIESPDINFFSAQTVQGNFPFVLEPGEIKISMYKDSLMNSSALGTISNDAFMKYKSETKIFVSSMNGIGRELQQASISRDTLLVADLQDQYKDVKIKLRIMRFVL